MIKQIQRIKDGILEVLFPTICAVCGLKLSSEELSVCTICLNDKFEEAGFGDSKSSSNIMLPEGIYLQHALWNFDKGGYLQDLMHQLKYNRLTGVGEDIGRQLGKSLMKNPWFVDRIKNGNAVLLPVPLHPRKRKTRGYNQAFFVAKGVSVVTGLAVVKREDVQRIKNTSTQTGFSLEKRRKNIDGAFHLKNPGKIKNSICVIIDDVFTTGATTFELAAVLKTGGTAEIIIATVAQA